MTTQAWLGFLTVLVASAVARAQPPAPSTGNTGTITGKVKVTEADGKLLNNTPIIVYVVGPPNSPAPTNQKPTQVAQINKAFKPDLVAVTIGDSVSFPNQEKSLLHNVFSQKPKFDLGSYKKGADPKPKTFLQPGVVDVYCNIHPEMAATILVLPNRHHTLTSNGSYKLEGVPVGEWTLFAYTRRATKPVSMKIKVVPGGIKADLSITRGADMAHKNKYGSKYTGY